MRALVEPLPPYLYPGEGNTVCGLDAELLDVICKQAGIEVNWIRGPIQRRKRRYVEFLNDHFDVVFSATPVQRNVDLAMYTRAYRQESMIVAAPAVEDPVLVGIRDFGDVLKSRVPLLYVEADGLGKEFEASRQRLRDAGLLIRYATARQGIEMLRAERAQLILGDALDLQEQSRALSFPLILQPYGHSSEPVSLMLSRTRLDEDDLARINQAIADLEHRGILEAIRNRYPIELSKRTGK